MTTEQQPTGRPARRLPEPGLPKFRDDGCHVWHRCLSCPLPQCIYDDPRGARSAVNEIRDQEIWQLYHQGWVTKRLAAHFGISPRQVFRIIDRRRHTDL